MARSRRSALGTSRPEELAAVYPHRWAIPRDVWTRFFESAEHEIGVLAYSALFLAEDAGLLGIIADKASRGVRVRIALGDPDCPRVAQRGQEEGIGDAMAAKIRNALTLYRPLAGSRAIEIRLHRTILYNSIYRADDQLFVNQHAYGIPAAHAPVFRLRRSPEARHVRELPRQLRAHLVARSPVPLIRMALAYDWLESDYTRSKVR